MGFLPRAFVAGGIGFAVSCLAACGGGAGLLSGNQSSALQTRLDRLASAVSGHRCGAASNQAAQLSSQVNHLPETINVTVRTSLARGVATVAQLASQDCPSTQSNSTSTTASTTSSTTTTTSTPSTTSTTSTSTPSTSSTTTTTTSTSTTPTTTTSTTTPSGGGGLGGGGASGSPGGQAGDPGAGPASSRGAGPHG